MVRGNRFISQITAKVRLWVVLSGLLMATTLFGMFVWPTRYRYDQTTMNDNVLPVRVDRMTGRTEILFPVGGEWPRARIKKLSFRPQNWKRSPWVKASLAGTARF